MGRVAKVTISLDNELLEVADRLAREENTSRSAIISRLIQQEERRRLDDLMIQGYKEMAKEDRREAEEFRPAQAEVVLHDS